MHLKTPYARLWRKRRLAAGLCLRCPRPLHSKTLCAECLIDQNKRSMEWFNLHRRKSNRVRGEMTKLILTKARSVDQITWLDLSPPLRPEIAKINLYRIAKRGDLIKTRNGFASWFRKSSPAVYKLNPELTQRAA